MATKYFYGASAWDTEEQKATGSFSFSGQPADADTLTIYGVTFEFDDDASVGGGNIAVEIGATLANTLANLETAIEGNVDATAAVNDSTINITSTKIGTAGNVANSFSCTAVSDYTGMSGGQDSAWFSDSDHTLQTTKPTTGDDVFLDQSLTTPPESAIALNSITGTILMMDLGWDKISAATGTFLNPITGSFAIDACTFDGGGAKLNSGSVLTGDATFSNGAINSGTVIGDATFTDAGNLGTVDGNADFSGTPPNGTNGNGVGNSGGTAVVTGNATFADTCHNWGIVNVDTTIVAQAPKMAPHIGAMRQRIAQALGLDEELAVLRDTGPTDRKSTRLNSSHRT